MSNPDVIEYTDDATRRANQLKVETLAGRHFWSGFDAILTRLIDLCENLAYRHDVDLWYQHQQGLITSSEFINKLVDAMSRDRSPIVLLGAAELIARADRICRKFSKNTAKPIGDFLLTEKKANTYLFGSWDSEKDAYHYCQAVGSALNDLDPPPTHLP